MPCPPRTRQGPTRQFGPGPGTRPARLNPNLTDGLPNELMTQPTTRPSLLLRVCLRLHCVSPPALLLTFPEPMAHRVYKISRALGWDHEDARSKQLAANERGREEEERKARRAAEKAERVSGCRVHTASIYARPP